MAPAPAALDPRTPVLVGVGQLNVRVDRGEDPMEPVAMLAEAARRAAADTGGAADRLLAGLDTVAVVDILSWRYRDPAALVAAHLGAAPARRWSTVAGGNYPQTLLNRAAVDISAGRADAVLVGGAEAWRTRTAARKAGTDLGWTVQGDDASPTEMLGDETPLAHEDEIARGLFMPVQLYPIFESAVRAAAGRDQAEHQRVVSELWARFSEVAAANPHAWIREARTAEEIRTAGPDNRMIGHPYPKLMNSNNSVEQAAALIVCSVERARDLGIPTDRWVFPWTGTDAHDTWFVGNRISLHRSPAIGIAGKKALELAAVGVDDLAHVDVYSCFPSAVQVAATELGLGLERQLTVTGGLSFAGGPWNDYVSHSIATMAEVLRADAGSVGLVTANGGYLTKHAFGVYSTTPPPRGRFAHRDCQAEVDAVGSVDLVADHEGAVRIEAATVMHDRDGKPEQAYLATRTPDRHRSWCTSTDDDVIALVTHDEPVGVAAHRTADGTLSL
ncbi:acetyl-CoA acetyltransferase [Iamia sp. SCSIO 61187]|uniref:acetyl-CoA acetyltransferase n=1 Tax=Iamia sp. SCSIO 61187 TaxID=2722752 RepID=UPI001C62EE0A|nr:acetyl-CoA acetyltransferase [Iamia sp. SCSIO 61187]QYG94600.1 acetyl-CoA acetyltransferase [Iamia sp. SCSIO 61187]